MKFRNILTGEQQEVHNLKMQYGRVFFSVRGKGCGQKFFNKWQGVLALDEQVAGGTYLRVCDGWEIADEPKERKPRTPKEDPAPAPAPQEQEEEPTPVSPEPEADPQEQQYPAPMPAPQAQPQQPTNADEVGKAIADVLKKLKVNPQVQVDEERVREIVDEKMAEIKQGKVSVVRIKVADLPEYELKKGTNEKLFKTLMTMVVNDRVIGRFPWLYGPAGSGKSTMAKMVADALGLPFYSVSSLQQKYELEGYSDAVGEFVQTSFYKAMAEGGIFVFDEISTTSGEVQVAFNTAAAQLCYNFPKIGMVDAHPDFHIIACDNSTGRGGDKRYISRFQLDASTLDRYNFLEVGYSPEHDLNMANGDEELVVFMNAVRKALDDANTTYLATPRASKAIKALQALDMTDRDALWYGLCSGWKKQDIRTIAARTNGYNHWFSTFKQIADEI